MSIETTISKTRIISSLLIVMSWLSCTSKECIEGKVLEKTIRQYAIRAVLPEFPQAALARGVSGVAVAEVVLSAKGVLKSVKILQAPDPSIAQTTEAAIRQWVFSTPQPGKDNEFCLKGRLTFYFVIEANRAYVRNPRKFENGIT